MTDSRATLETIAPTVEEAIEKGLNELGLSQEDVNVKVLDEGSSGLLGLGSRQARIMLIVNHEEAEPTPEEDTDSSTDSADEDYLINLASGTISDLLAKMKLDNAEIDTYLGEPYGPYNRVPVHVDIHGDDLSILIGHRGKTLNALQYIGKLILGKELEQSVPLVIDVEGYRDRREQQIRRMANQVANQVIRAKHKKSLEPMPANERRFAHIELEGNPKVYTESTGSGRHRKVIIYPQN
ncbi:MAG: RNA-binding cell elongation regulator Jag/EloR [Chloroflexota bacterium]|nr:RNA-binding cell elongation regulator Jag/EloR [Chloroflexota bacterium]